jgi:hypothetical protein
MADFKNPHEEEESVVGIFYLEIRREKVRSRGCEREKKPKYGAPPLRKGGELKNSGSSFSSISSHIVCFCLFTPISVLAFYPTREFTGLSKI